MHRNLSLAIVFTIVCSSIAGSCSAVDLESLEKDGVYRFQPGMRESTMELVPPEELKAGLAYNYYHPSLQRHVWGFAQEDGSFKYAFGEGTILPVDRLDLRISQELRERLIERAIPGLLKRLETTGDTPAVKLLKDDDWELLPMKSSLRVFDLATGHRWEWHGRNRKAVLHTYGDQWQIVEGRYVPATGPVFVVGAGSCSGPRAGSAVLVMRTPE